MDPSDAKALLEKYPTRTPVIVRTYNGEISLKRSKYLVPNDLRLGEFMAVLRRYTSSLRPEEAMYAFFNDKMYPQNIQIGRIFAVEQRNFHLLMTICKETTFG